MQCVGFNQDFRDVLTNADSEALDIESLQEIEDDSFFTQHDMVQQPTPKAPQCNNTIVAVAKYLDALLFQPLLNTDSAPYTPSFSPPQVYQLTRT